MSAHDKNKTKKQTAFFHSKGSLHLKDVLQNPIYISRLSKSCNQAITQLRKVFENLRKFWTKERKTGITT